MIKLIKKLKRRYFFGKILDNKEWEKRVLKVCKKWLLKTPTLSKTDEKQTIFEKLNKKNRKDSIQVWQSGSLYLALKEYDENIAELAKFERDVRKKHELSVIKDSDYGLLCFALCNKEDFSDFSATMLSYIQNNIAENGTIYYKENVKSAAFVDTLGFICPYLTKIGVINGQEEYVNLAKRQIELYFENGVEKNSLLPFHAYTFDKKIPLGICDWARGLGWLLIALMDSYLTLLKDGKEDEFFKEKILQYADIICDLQKSSGAYSWKLFGNRESDSSATAVFGWFLSCCYGIFKNDRYLNSARKCRDYLKSVTYNNGIIDYCQGDTISIGVYSRSFDKMPFAEAFALRMQVRLSYYD